MDQWGERQRTATDKDTLRMLQTSGSSLSRGGLQSLEQSMHLQVTQIDRREIKNASAQAAETFAADPSGRTPSGGSKPATWSAGLCRLGYELQLV